MKVVGNASKKLLCNDWNSASWVNISMKHFSLSGRRLQVRSDLTLSPKRNIRIY